MKKYIQDIQKTKSGDKEIKREKIKKKKYKKKIKERSQVLCKICEILEEGEKEILEYQRIIFEKMFSFKILQLIENKTKQYKICIFCSFFLSF